MTAQLTGLAREAREGEVMAHVHDGGEMGLPDFMEITAAGAAEADTCQIGSGLLPRAMRAPATHTVCLGSAWTNDDSRVSPEFKEAGFINRGDLFEFARTARQSPGSWTQLLINTFAWGWGSTSFGPSRLTRVLEATDAQVVESNLRQAVATLDEHGAVAAYWDLNNISRFRLKHLGPAFFTKFLYFAADGGPCSRPRPLILDKVVAGRVNTLIGQEGRLAGGGWSTRDYAFYLAVMDRLVALLNQRDSESQWTTDAAELGIFQAPAAPDPVC